MPSHHHLGEALDKGIRAFEQWVATEGVDARTLTAEDLPVGLVALRHLEAHLVSGRAGRDAYTAARKLLVLVQRTKRAEDAFLGIDGMAWACSPSLFLQEDLLLGQREADALPGSSYGTYHGKTRRVANDMLAAWGADEASLLEALVQQLPRVPGAYRNLGLMGACVLGLAIAAGRLGKAQAAVQEALSVLDEWPDGVEPWGCRGGLPAGRQVADSVRRSLDGLRQDGYGAKRAATAQAIGLATGSRCAPRA